MRLARANFHALDSLYANHLAQPDHIRSSDQCGEICWRDSRVKSVGEAHDYQCEGYAPCETVGHGNVVDLPVEIQDYSA